MAFTSALQWRWSHCSSHLGGLRKESNAADKLGLDLLKAVQAQQGRPACGHRLHELTQAGDQ